MKQRFLYLWCPHLSTQRYIQASRSPEEKELWRKEPFATTTQDHRGVYLCGVNSAALSMSLQSAMRLSDACAIFPALQSRPVSIEADRAWLLEMAQVGERFSPWIALDGPHPLQGDGGLWFDITGAAHLFGGEAAMMQQVMTCYGNVDLDVRLGVADTAPAAWAAARFQGKDGRLSEGGTRKETADFPLEALNLDGDTVQRLNRLGLRLVRDITTLPRANVTVRFGPEIIHQVDRLLGDLPTRLTYLQQVRFPEIQRFFAEPLGSLEIIENAVWVLLEELCENLREAGLGVRRLGVCIRRVDNQASVYTIGTSAPTHKAKDIFRLLQEDLPGVDPGFGVEHIHLRASMTQWIDHQQAGFDPTEQQVGSEAQHTLIDRLRHRLGAAQVFQMQRHASYIPERAMGQYASMMQPLPDLPERPLRLLSPPEPVSVLSHRGDGLPEVMEWRRLKIAPQQWSGPERMTREWWRKLDHDMWDAVLGMRDYFRMQDEAGRDLWLCRTPGPQDQIRWFVHGWFG